MSSTAGQSDELGGTQTLAYTERLRRRSSVGPFDVQLPYRLNLQALRLGKTLDVGCGVGRNLRNLTPDSVGVDHNEHSVAVCQTRDLPAFTTSDFDRLFSARCPVFDSLVFAHVLEHMTFDAAQQLAATYVEYVRPGGRVVIITPQAAGFASDPTHVQLLDFRDHRALLLGSRCTVRRHDSFPFPTFAGRIFKHNEFITIGVKPGSFTGE